MTFYLPTGQELHDTSIVVEVRVGVDFLNAIPVTYRIIDDHFCMILEGCPCVRRV